MNLFKKSNIKWLVTALVPVTAIFLFLWRLLPYHTDDMMRSVVSIEHRYHYVIKDGDSTLLYYDGITADTLFLNPSLQKKDCHENATGCWVNGMPLIPSCKGRIATVLERTDSCMLDTALVRKVITDEIANYDNTLAAFEHAATEIAYYIDTHSINDEGYGDVIRYRDSLRNENTRIENISAALMKAAGTASLSVEKCETYYVVYKDSDGRLVRKECLYVPTKNISGNVILQTCDSITPEGVQALNAWHLLPSDCSNINDTVFVVGRSFVNRDDMMKRNIEMIPEHIKGNEIKSFPRLNISDGSPVFTRNGIFIGITSGDTIIRRSVIRKSF